MPKRLTREETKARTRRRLLDAATKLFTRDGFMNTTLDQIAAAAGVTTGAVYSNFKNKEDLFLALVDDSVWIADVPSLPEGSRADRYQRTGEMMAGEHRFAAVRLSDRGAGGGSTSASPEWVATPSSPKELAVHLEAYAYALRDAGRRRAIGERLSASFVAFLADLDAARDATDEAEPGADDPRLQELVVARALVEGLDLMRGFLPDVVTPELYGKALRLVAALGRDD